MDEVDKNAKIIWDYMQLHQELHKCEAIVCIGGLDKRPAEHAAQLLLDGYGKYLVFSGGLGKITEKHFSKPEADIYADIARNLNVPEEKIIVENRSTNTGENIRFTYDLLKLKGNLPRSIILVQKPYMERRAYATFKKQWPDLNTEILVTSPKTKYEDYFNEEVPKDLILNVMVGDLQRIKEYPRLGYQIEQEIPERVWQAFESLVNAGYSKHLLTAF